ncbi:MAG: hypothetical protein K9J75_02055 [Cyanobium usitatum Tobar12.5m-G36]|nr:hypothetical protein [Cyanobium usitatum Tobar12.5m-G36]
MTEPAPSSSALATASPAQITAPKAAPADISSGVFSGIAAFEAAQRMAQALCTSTMVPSEYRGQQGLSNSLIALEIAARMGLSPLVVMQNMTPIHGKPSWSSSFLIATVNSSGRFTPLRFVFDDKDNPSSCFAVARDKATGEVLEGQLISIEMAKREGWWSRPDRYGKETSKWQSMTGQMLRYRASAFWVKVYCPEISLGLMTQDEVADVQAVVVGSVEPLAAAQLPATPEPLTKARQALGEQVSELPAVERQDGAAEEVAAPRRSPRRSTAAQKQVQSAGKTGKAEQQQGELAAAAEQPAELPEQAEPAGLAGEQQELSSAELLNKALQQISGLGSADALESARQRVNRLLAEGRLNDEGAQRLWTLIQRRLQQLEVQGAADAQSESEGAKP